MDAPSASGEVSTAARVLGLSLTVGKVTGLQGKRENDGNAVCWGWETVWPQWAQCHVHVTGVGQGSGSPSPSQGQYFTSKLDQVGPPAKPLSDKCLVIVQAVNVCYCTWKL